MANIYPQLAVNECGNTSPPKIDIPINVKITKYVKKENYDFTKQKRFFLTTKEKYKSSNNKCKCRL
jgi:hypothetical protein